VSHRRDENVPRGFENTYQNFVWKELGIIRELERAGEYYEALAFSVSLLKYLQPEVREKQEKHAKTLLLQVKETVRQIGGRDFFTNQLAKNRVAERLGREYLEEVIGELTSQLAGRAYMEKGAAASPRRRSKERMKVPDYEEK